jgi:hypothetical protein
MSSLWTPGGERPVGRPEEPAAPGPEEGLPPDLTPEQRAELEQLMAMQEELAAVPAGVVIANHAIGLFQLAAIHLNQRPPNLEEGRLAIDAMGALVEGMTGRLGEEEASLRDGLAQLRLAFVQLSGGAEPAAGPEPGAPTEP